MMRVFSDSDSVSDIDIDDDCSSDQRLIWFHNFFDQECKCGNEIPVCISNFNFKQFMLHLFKKLVISRSFVVSSTVPSG